MEPNKIIPTPAVNTNPSQDPNTPLDGLRDEGIDIVQGSGVSEDNEFSNGEATPVEIFESASVAENVPVAPVVPPTPRAMVSVVPPTALTVTISSLFVSSPMMAVKGYVEGQPVTELIAIVVATLVNEADNVAATAVEE